ncbi:hypothetical protein [Achromobacter xylosoxidans]|uniref:hypothetical protein n=1 Tax=Alcaligenes xylosoxydans xylosoxydans TaxID=85698 RepID=UPI003D2BF2D3
MEKLLDQKVRELLHARRGGWLDIAMRAKVSHSWISKFVNGHIPNPGYGRLQRLAELLEAAPMDVATAREAESGLEKRGSAHARH